jgi:HAD superfamily hydrolase (TIGR01549 family)
MGAESLWEHFTAAQITDGRQMTDDKQRTKDEGRIDSSTPLAVVPERSRKVKAVLFDLGETLLHFGKVDTVVFFREGAKLSYDYLKSQGQVVGSFWYYQLRSFITLRIHRWLSSVRGKDLDTLTMLKRIGAKKGIKLNEQQWRHYAWLWYEPLSMVGRIEPQTIETLSKLRSSGLKLGIVSNTFINAGSIEKHLKQLGILDLFDVRLFSYQFDFRKPSSKIFKVAADRIGEMLGNILFVGDRIDKDISPAIKSGMHVVLKQAYTNIGKKIPKGVWEINQLSELPAVIEEINAAATQEGR